MWFFHKNSNNIGMLLAMLVLRGELFHFRIFYIK
jgi:hypothetical protein